jgi:acyl carrier protein
MTMPADDHKEVITFEQFRAIIAEQLQIDEEKVVPEASFVNDLAADSIQLVDMMLQMEIKGVVIPLEAAWDVETVGDAYKLYQAHLNEQTTP